MLNLIELQNKKKYYGQSLENINRTNSNQNPLPFPNTVNPEHTAWQLQAIFFFFFFFEGYKLRRKENLIKEKSEKEIIRKEKQWWIGES